MKTIKGFILILIVLSLGFGCGKPSGKEEQSAQEAKDTAAEEIVKKLPEDSIKTFNLMEHSALDTCQGVFEGEWDEDVGNDRTVMARVRVSLEDCRITGIEILDTTLVNPQASLVIPQRIIEEQYLPVETVTGASVSSWTIMTAVAVALEIDLTELEEEQ